MQVNQIVGSERVKLSDPLYAEALDWLIEEAHLLDNRRFDDWLATLSPDLSYVMPVQQSGELTSSSPTSGYFHLDENYRSIALRVDRVKLPSAWIEEPFTRTRRFVSNLRVREHDAEVSVESYLLVMCSRQASPTWEMISCLRRDLLTRNDSGQLLLVRREITTDQVALGLTSLSIFL